MEMFKDIWVNGIVSFDTCCLGRMYEWESLYAVNIKDARWKGESLTIYPDEILQEETIFMEDGTRRIVDLLVSFTKADPAIYVEKWEGQIAIEINDTHPVDSKKISQMKQKGLACLEFTVSKWTIREDFSNAEDEEKQIGKITEKLDGKNGGYIRGELLVDPISRIYFRTKLYEDEKREKEGAIAELKLDGIVEKTITFCIA